MTAINPDTFNEFDARYLLREGWRDWTPTVTQGVSVTVTVTYARYIILAQLAIVQARLAITSAGTGGSVIVIGGQDTPIRPANTGSTSHVIGVMTVVDTGTINYTGNLFANTATDWRALQDSGGQIGINPSFALASGDFISFLAAFERA